MSNKFLQSSGNLNLTNGSQTIFAKSLGATNLTSNKALHTNASKVIDTVSFDLPAGAGLLGQLMVSQGDGTTEWKTESGLGDVIGPASAVDEQVCVFDGITGKLIKSTPIEINSSGNITEIGLLGLNELGGGPNGCNIALPPGSSSYTMQLPPNMGSPGYVLTTNGLLNTTWEANPGGDVSGPVSSTDTAIAIYNGLTGKIIQDSVLTIDNNGNIDKSGVPFIHERGGTANFAAGTNALDAIIGGINNVAIGFNSMVNSTDSNNVAVGARSLQTNTSGQSNVALGNSAMQDNTVGGSNTAVGSLALSNNTDADFNTAIGSSSMITNTTGEFNVAVGAQSLQNNVTADNNTAVGFEALESNTASFNTAMGSTALKFNTTGSSNVAIGVSAMQQSVSPDNCVAVGAVAMTNNEGDNCIGIGFSALNFNTGNNNIGIGLQALNTNTTGVQNVGVGSSALTLNNIGNDNTAVGFQALRLNDATDNTAVGSEALEFNTTGVRNTAVGRSALENNDSGDQNVAMGHQSLEEADASNNTAVGFASSTTLTIGTRNTSLGANSLNLITSGNDNVCIGHNAGSAFTLGDSANVCIGNPGVSGQNSKVYLGETGVHFTTALVGGLTLDTAYSTPVTGGTVLVGQNVSIVVIEPAGTLANLDIEMPVSPLDGAFVKITITQSITNLIHNGSGNTILAPFPATTPANTSGSWYFRNATSTWYSVDHAEQATGGGNVFGPVSSTTTAIARYSDTTGKVLLNSGITLDSGSNLAGVADINGKAADDLLVAPGSTSSNTILPGSLSLPNIYSTPLTGANVVIANTASVVVIEPAGALPVLTVTMPAAPFDRQILHITIVFAVSSLTHSGNGNTLLAPFPKSTSSNTSGTWYYRNATSTWYSLLKPEIPYSKGYVSGLLVTAMTVDQITINSGSCRSSDNLSNINTSLAFVNMTLAGPGGLQTGQVRTINTWYGIYAISDSTGANIDRVYFREQNTVMSEPGWDRERLVGSVFNDGSDELRRTTWSGTSNTRQVMYEGVTRSELTIIDSVGGSIAWVTQSASNHVPANTAVMHIATEFDLDDDFDLLYLRSGIDSTITQTDSVLRLGGGILVPTFSENNYYLPNIPLNPATPSFDWSTTTNDNDMHICAVGYIQEL